MPAAFLSFVGRSSYYKYRNQADAIGHGGNQTHAQIGGAGLFLDDRGQPEGKAIHCADNEEVSKRQEDHLSLPERFQDAVRTHRVLCLLLEFQLRSQPFALVVGKPVRLMWPIR